MQPGLEYLASPVDVIDLLLFEKTDDALLRFRRGHMVEPVGLRFDILRSDNLNLVAALNRCKNRFDFMVDLRPDGTVTDIGMNVVGKIQGRRSLRQCPGFAFGCKNNNFVGVKA